MKKLLPLLIFTAMLLVSGILYGVHTERWLPTVEMEQAVARIDDIPLDFGDWHGVKIPVDASDLLRVGIKGHLFARYQNTRTGAAFNVLLVCGRPGPISVHTPDICYEGAGFEANGAPEHRELTLSDDQRFNCWALRFQKKNASVTTKLEIYWVWKSGDDWLAPDNPRIAFARKPILYKLYVIREIPPGEKQGKINPFLDFLQEFLPRANDALSPKLVS